MSVKPLTNEKLRQRMLPSSAPRLEVKVELTVCSSADRSLEFIEEGYPCSDGLSA